MVTNIPVQQDHGGTLPATDRGMADQRYQEGTMMGVRNMHPHWGSIFAGIFVGLSTLALLSTLGIAIGASAYDPGDNARNWGIGAGIWALVSGIIAFMVGGYVAAVTSTYNNYSKGTLHGFMVWAVSIPLLALVVGSGLTGLASGAASNSNMVPNMGNGSNAGARVDANGNRTDANGNRVDANHDNVTAQDAKSAAMKTAWGGFASLVLGLIAATLGGYLGSMGPGRRPTLRTPGEVRREGTPTA